METMGLVLPDAVMRPSKTEETRTKEILTPEIHPGEILEEEFLKPIGLSRYRLSKETGLSETQIAEIIRGERGITAATALRLSAYFGNTPRFWLNLQASHDLIVESRRLQNELSEIRPLAASAM